MSLKLATLIAHDGKTVIKVNPLRGNSPISPDRKFTAIHFGSGRSAALAADCEAAAAPPSGI